MFMLIILSPQEGKQLAKFSNVRVTDMLQKLAVNFSEFSIRFEKEGNSYMPAEQFLAKPAIAKSFRHTERSLSLSDPEYIPKTNIKRFTVTVGDKSASASAQRRLLRTQLDQRYAQLKKSENSTAEITATWLKVESDKTKKEVHRRLVSASDYKNQFRKISKNFASGV